MPSVSLSINEKVEKAKKDVSKMSKRAKYFSITLIVQGAMGMTCALFHGMKARSTASWLLEMAKNGWGHHQKQQEMKVASENISRDEFELYDLLRNMMALTFLISTILVIIGKMGLKSVKANKSKKA